MCFRDLRLHHNVLGFESRAARVRLRSRTFDLLSPAWGLGSGRLPPTHPFPPPTLGPADRQGVEHGRVGAIRLSFGGRAEGLFAPLFGGRTKDIPSGSSAASTPKGTTARELAAGRPTSGHRGATRSEES